MYQISYAFDDDDIDIDVIEKCASPAISLLLIFGLSYCWIKMILSIWLLYFIFDFYFLSLCWYRKFIYHRRIDNYFRISVNAGISSYFLE